MKTLQTIVLSFIALLLSIGAFAQAKTDTFHVSGECNMCKKKIETAAKAAGATYASWNVDSKTLTVKYNSESANAAKIQQRIADAGYDTPGAKASDSAYKSLDECCQYDRGTTSAAKADCCGSAMCCTKADCCSRDATCCAKDGICCKDGTCMHDSKKATSMKMGAGSCCAKS